MAFRENSEKSTKYRRFIQRTCTGDGGFVPPAAVSRILTLRMNREMSEKKKCSCGCGSIPKKEREYRIPAEDESITLADLPVGATATIIKVMPGMRGRKKFADVGIVAGTELLMEAHAPFGGLPRVKVMETSMALHRHDAMNIMMKKEEGK